MFEDVCVENIPQRCWLIYSSPHFCRLSVAHLWCKTLVLPHLALLDSSLVTMEPSITRFSWLRLLDIFLLEVAVRRWIHCGHKSIDMSSIKITVVFVWCSISAQRPKKDQENVNTYFQSYSFITLFFHLLFIFVYIVYLLFYLLSLFS